MKIFEINHREVLAQGWTSMFIIFTANLMLDSLRCNSTGTCTPYYEHFGSSGVTMITTFMLVYAVMPILIRTIAIPQFRNVVIPITFFITMMYFGHELGHISSPEEGGKPFGFSHALDIAHHVIGISMAIVAISWVRQTKKAQSMAKTAEEGAGA